MADTTNYDDTIGALEIVQDCFTEFGEYVNTNRLIPHVGDGLLSVYRRSLLATRNFTTKTKSMAAIADTLKYYHPHGDASVKPVIDTLVRRQLLEGQGNFGARLMEDIKAAAPRYTEVKRKKEVSDVLFKLLDYSPHFRNEMQKQEPHYLITPVPLALVYGQNGVGLGCTTRIPAFTYESLVQAYLHDDPKYLKLNFGYRLTGGDISDLWYKGVGRLKIEMDVQYEKSKEDDGIWVSRIRGSGELFKPALGHFDELVDTGRVFIRDESTRNIHIVIGRTKGTRAISSDEIYKIALRCAKFNRKYDIKVNLNGKVKRVGIRDWLKVTMSNYEKHYEQWRQDKTADIRDQIFRHLITPPTAEMLRDNKDNDVILKELNKKSLDKKWKQYDRQVTDDDVVAVSKRPLRMLRQTDFSNEILKLEADLEEAMGATPASAIEEAGRVLRIK